VAVEKFPSTAQQALIFRLFGKGGYNRLRYLKPPANHSHGQTRRSVYWYHSGSGFRSPTRTRHECDQLNRTYQASGDSLTIFLHNQGEFVLVITVKGLLSLNYYRTAPAVTWRKNERFRIE